MPDLRTGQLYPILVDYHGNIIDGEHRFGVDAKWRKVRLEHIKTEKDRLIARIVSNTVKRSVPSREKRGLLERLGEIYLNEGVKPGKISHKIMEETGMSYRWVMKYLADRFKDDAQSERASSAARHAAGENPKRRIIPGLEEPPKGTVMIKVYTNREKVLRATGGKSQKAGDNTGQTHIQRNTAHIKNLACAKLLAKARKPAKLAMAYHPFYEGKVQVMSKCAIRGPYDFAEEV